METVKLSILVPVYNHSRYIKQCIDGILMQKVNFNYEVIIGEDCSTDNTAEILCSIEKDLPANYKVLYRETNMGGRGKNNVEDLIKRATGEYYIFVEGDDYWTYEYKLQQQVDFLDTNKEYIAICHNCAVVDENSKKIDYKYPECKDEDYTFKHYLNKVLMGQTATVMYRRSYYVANDVFSKEYRLYDSYPGDQLKSFLLRTVGKVKCIQEQWSAYRYVTSQGTSYSATVTVSDTARKNEFLFLKSIFTYSKNINNKDAVLTAGKLYYEVYFKRSIDKTKFASLTMFFKDIFKEKYFILYIFYIIKSMLRIFVRKIAGR